MTTAGSVYGEFGFDRRVICRYWMCGGFLLFSIGALAAAIATRGISLLLVPPALVLMRLWIGLVFRRLLYEVDEDSVNIRSGVLFHQEKVIPLEKITDIRLLQGSLMRAFGCYALMIQTAGTGTGMPEGTMVFESHAKAVQIRERIMTARQRWRASLLHAGTGDE